MSALLAAGCARSRFQSVSVVPMIQCVPQGITKSTELAVRRINPTSELIRSRATTMCTPLDARTLKRPASPGERLDLVGPHPGAVDDDGRFDAHPGPGLDVLDNRTGDALPRPGQLHHPRGVENQVAPYAAAVRATVSVCRASSICAS
jgi:hypothetical protein